jgi:mRNA-degrading endonuclease RelE of RelBE toxin-antitoxin system
MYVIEYAESVAKDLAHLRASERAQILDRIEAQLRYQPTQQTRNRKVLVGLLPPWDHLEPIWELRMGPYRVFYDVDEAVSVVYVRAIRHKPPHKTTEEIL